MRSPRNRDSPVDPVALLESNRSTIGLPDAWEFASATSGPESRGIPVLRSARSGSERSEGVRRRDHGVDTHAEKPAFAENSLDVLAPPRSTRRPVCLGLVSLADLSGDRPKESGNRFDDLAQILRNVGCPRLAQKASPLQSLSGLICKARREPNRQSQWQRCAPSFERIPDRC